MQQSFDVAGPAELEIRLASGDITIDATAEGRVEVELIAHDEESQRLVDEATIELREHGGRPQVIVDVPNKRGFNLGQMFGRQGITCRVRCPQGSGREREDEVRRPGRARRSSAGSTSRPRPATSRPTASPAA